MKNEKLYISGHNGLLGKAVLKCSKQEYRNIIHATKNELDLLDREAVSNFFIDNKPDLVINCAAKAGGILANKNSPFTFINENNLIQTNCINAAFEGNVKKFIFISSTCIYPKLVKQPMNEDSLLSGPFTEETQPYCIAKICGMEMLSSLYKQHNFQSASVLLPNLYGPGDHYGDSSNHVIPALIEKFITAKDRQYPKVDVWGSGSAIREFLYVDDAADGILFILENYNSDKPINLSSHTSISIKDLAFLIRDLTSFKGDIRFDHSKPDGAPIKVSDNTKIKSLGWKSKTSIEVGLKNTIKDYCERFMK